MSGNDSTEPAKSSSRFNRRRLLPWLGCAGTAYLFTSHSWLHGMVYALVQPPWRWWAAGGATVARRFASVLLPLLAWAEGETFVSEAVPQAKPLYSDAVLVLYRVDGRGEASAGF